MSVIPIYFTEFFNIPWFFRNIANSFAMNLYPLAIMTNDGVWMKIMLIVITRRKNFLIFFHSTVQSGLIRHEITVVIDFMAN